ncbi:MAG: sulfite exporter TauE/SafE family protein [Isosphaeraceae bacterium]
MVIDGTTFLVLAVLFLATLIRSAFGFGEALVAVPLLALLMPVEVAAPVAVLVSITVAAVILLQDWRHVQLQSAWRLVVSTLFGIPLGLLMLINVEESVVKALLAVVIMSFSALCLIRRHPWRLKSDRLAWFFGFGAGVLGGAYGMNGPPLVIYGALRGWSPAHFRATLQGYFLPASIVVTAGYWSAGLWTSDVTKYFLLALVPVLGAILLGRVAHHRLNGPAFIVYIYVGLIVIGIVLFVQSVTI